MSGCGGEIAAAVFEVTVTVFQVLLASWCSTGMALLVFGGVGMFVLELVAAVGDSSDRRLALVLAAGSVLCLLGAGLRRATGGQWFFGVLGFALNAGGVYAFNDALCEGSLVEALLLVPGLLLFSVGTAFVLMLDDPDFGHPGGGGGVGGVGGGDGGGGGC